MRHVIDLDEMLAWIDSENGRTVTYAQSGGTKKLEIKLSGGYRVSVMADGNDKQIVYEGMDGKSAVDAYNALQ